MNYKQAVDYIEETPKFTKKNSLEHTRECLRRLGNPQDKFKVIHVAGTNGKGSVCAFIASILREGGFACGLFTSPHLVTINERFQIDEVAVDDETFLKAFLKVRELSQELVEEGNYHPTYFEMLFLMGMIIFAEKKVEYVVLETGLGGRMDATNSIENPIASVITSIGLDHIQYLGDTIGKIAGEKAGIIKAKIPVIYDENKEEATTIISQTGEEMKSPLYPVTTQDSQIESVSPDGIDFSFSGNLYGEQKYHIPFIAPYQVMNASLALTCMGVLSKKLGLTLEHLQNGLARTRWQGRMETIASGVIVDGAHNEDGIQAFLQTAEYFQKDYPLTLLFSAVSDKDYGKMIEEICERIAFQQVITTEVGGYREVPAKELAELFEKNGCKNVSSISGVEKAYCKAAAAKGHKGLLFCAGSLYLVGEIKTYLANEKIRGDYD